MALVVGATRIMDDEMNILVRRNSHSAYLAPTTSPRLQGYRPRRVRGRRPVSRGSLLGERCALSRRLCRGRGSRPALLRRWSLCLSHRSPARDGPARSHRVASLRLSGICDLVFSAHRTERRPDAVAAGDERHAENEDPCGLQAPAWAARAPRKTHGGSSGDATARWPAARSRAGGRPAGSPPPRHPRSSSATTPPAPQPRRR
jgi:hypothetical protein